MTYHDVKVQLASVLEVIAVRCGETFRVGVVTLLGAMVHGQLPIPTLPKSSFHVFGTASWYLQSCDSTKLWSRFLIIVTLCT